MNPITRILSWDVGIKNLAYCVINKDNINNSFKIEEWKIIDLTDGNEKKCCGILKKKKTDNNDTICGANAKLYVVIDDVKKYYCMSHKSQHNITIQQIELENVTEYNNTNLDLCEFVSPKAKKSCTKKAQYMIDNHCYCKTHKETNVKNIFNSKSLKAVKNIKCGSGDPQSLCEKLYDKLSKISLFSDIDEVYIENQPSFVNPTMKAVSSMLFSYFVFLFKFNKLSNKKKFVKFVSPSLKLKLDSDLIKFTEDKINTHNIIKKEKCLCRICKLSTELTLNKNEFNENYIKYKFNYDSIKELGIIYTEKILSTNLNNEFQLINEYSKKDDLCDAFLHGYKRINLNLNEISNDF